MMFRTRLLIALGAIAVGPLVMLAMGVRTEMEDRLTSLYQDRTAALAAGTRGELSRRSAAVGERLASLREALVDDNRFRVAALQGADTERPYLLDFAGRAMRLTGLSMLQIQDENGRILSSGHFRNEFDRLEPDLPTLLASLPAGTALARVGSPDTTLLVLARVDSLKLGTRRFTLVGGVAVDPTLLGALVPNDDAVAATLITPADVPTDGGGGGVPLSAPRATLHGIVVAELSVPYIGPATDHPRTIATARLVMTRPATEIDLLRASIDRWFLIAVIAVAGAAIVAAIWLAARIARPLSVLAAQTAGADLDRLDVDFATDRSDEIGVLSRLLGAMTMRMRASAARARDAERRATIGDLARQVNHDMKNGLVPIRHVLRHLATLEREDPARVGAVFAERRPTLDASVAYLDALARSYARLTPRVELRPCDVNAVARVVAAGAAGRMPVSVELHPDLPAVAADPLVLRRILENLVGNAIDAGDPVNGTVTIGTARGPDGGARVTIADTGRGMSAAEAARAFDDFYSTKPGGTGLGLSIVRRLVTDLGAAMQVETAPGSGTRVQITFSRVSAVPGDGVRPAAAPAA